MKTTFFFAFTKVSNGISPAAKEAETTCDEELFEVEPTSLQPEDAALPPLLLLPSSPSLLL